MKLTKLLNEGTLNELNPNLNKKVKAYMDAYLKGMPASSPEFHHTVMMVLKGALTDANFHSEAKKLDSLFPKAKKSKYYDNSNMNDVMEDKGVDIARWAKWDGHDIIDAFAFYTSMTIGGGFGNKLETLKESISELLDAEMLAETNYSSKLTEEASKEAMGIAAFTGTRGIAVDDFIKKNKIDAKKLFNFVKKGNLKDRMAFVSAIAGRPGNKMFKMITKQFSESMKLSSLVEASNTYFKAAYEAAEYARELAEKKGYEIDEDDWQSQIGMGGKHNRLRPGVGQTHSFSVGLIKNGKPQRKALNISLYGMASGSYELTTYIN